MTRHRIHIITVTVALLMVIPACSSGPDTDLHLDAVVAAATEVVPASQAETTTFPTPATTVATNESTTDATTTTTPETTTTTAAPEVAVEATFRASIEERRRCSYDPGTCDFAIIAYPGSPLDEFTREIFATRIESDLRAVPGFGEFSYDVESVMVDGASAHVVTCADDSIVIFDIQDPANPNDDIIVDDVAASTRVDWSVEYFADGWHVTESSQLEPLEDGTSCAS